MLVLIRRFPDRENFGRTNMQLTDEELVACLLYQLGAIKVLCESENIPLSYVKPHGALYNQAAKDPALAHLIAHTIKQFDPTLALMGLSGSLMLNVAQAEGLNIISVFADRQYLADGSLVPRSRDDALVENDEEAIHQVLQMILSGTVSSVMGWTLQLKQIAFVFMVTAFMRLNLLKNSCSFGRKTSQYSCII